MVGQRNGKTTYPLGLVLLPALGNGQRVAEDSIVRPKLELCEVGSAREEVKNRSDDSSLLSAELDTGRRVEVGALELELAGVGGRHPALLGRSRCARVACREYSSCCLCCWVRCGGSVGEACKLWCKWTHWRWESGGRNWKRCFFPMGS